MEFLYWAIIIVTTFIAVVLILKKRRTLSEVRKNPNLILSGAVPREFVRCGFCREITPKGEIYTLVDYLYNPPKVFDLCPHCKKPLREVVIKKEGVEKMPSTEELEYGRIEEKSKRKHPS